MSEKIPTSEITPPEVYFDRRTVSAGHPGGQCRRDRGRLSQAQRRRPRRHERQAARRAGEGHGEGRRDGHAARSITNYNNFYEFTTDKDGVAEARRRASRPTGWKVDGRRARPQAARVRPRRSAADQPARGARLSHALRRGVVDGDSVGRLLAVEAARAGRADGEREVRRVRDAARSDADAEPDDRRARVAVRRGPADGRGDASARRSSRPGSTARSCRRRTARRCGWSCRGSTASRASSRSSRSRSSTKQPPTTWNIARAGRVRLLRERQPAVTITRAGARRPSSASARSGRRKTLMFNGYADQVASLYAGMDLDANF